MSVTHARATFRVFPGAASAASVTQRLDIAPAESHEAGEPNTRTGRPWAAAHWSITSTLPQDEPVSAHLSQLLDTVEPVADLLTALQEDGMRMDWFCYVYRENGQGRPSFTPDLLRRLGALPAVLGLDVY